MENQTNSAPTHAPRRLFFMLLLSALFIAASSGALGYYMGIRSSAGPSITPPPGDFASCTMEAKICPDGTSVGRVPPQCDFAPCPDFGNDDSASPAPSPSTVTGSTQEVDFSQCKVGSGYNKTIGFGSTSLEVQKNEGERCTVRTKNETENDYIISQCEVPKSIGKLYFVITDKGSDFSPLQQYCNSTSRGTVDFGN